MRLLPVQSSAGYTSQPLSVFNPVAINPFDLSSLENNISSGVSGQETSPTGVDFSADGLKMFVVGTTGDDVNEYSLSDKYNLDETYIQTFDPALGNIEDIYIRADGLMYYLVDSSNDTILQYQMAVSNDVSTSSLVRSVAATPDSTNPTSIFFKPDGSVMYLLSQAGTATDTVFQYALSESWNPDTKTLTTQFSVGTEEGAPEGLSFSDDGSEMFVVGTTSNNIIRYSLSTPWLISTASLTQAQASTITAMSGIRIVGDCRAYVTQTSTDTVESFSFGADIFNQTGNAYGIYFSGDGTKYYVMSSANDIYQYSLTTPFDVSTKSFVGSFDLVSVLDGGLYLSPDGTKLYNTTGTGVQRHDLSVPFNVTSAVLNQTFVTPSTNPAGIFFSPDGLSMYTDAIQYSLSTAWDMSTAVQVASIAGVVTFNSLSHDGKYFYYLLSGSIQYRELANPWDLTSALGIQTVYTGTVLLSPDHLYVRPDGAGFFMAGNSDKIYQFK